MDGESLMGVAAKHHRSIATRTALNVPGAGTSAATGSSRPVWLRGGRSTSFT